MALTKDDIQAIATLLEPIYDRLGGVDNRLDSMDNRLDSMEYRLDKLDSEVMALRAGQIGIRTELKEMNQKISDTYELALEAWGKSTENREWIEKVNVN